MIDEVRLSSLQLEAVVYACQQHKNILADGSRGGYLVGKSREGEGEGGRKGEGTERRGREGERGERGSE